MTYQVRFFPISRWNLTGKIVKTAFSHNTAVEAESAGRNAEVYGDQKFERVFEGSWEQYDALCRGDKNG